MCQVGVFGLLHAAADECEVVFFSIMTLVQGVAALWSLVGHAPDVIAFAVACLVMASAVAIFEIAAALVLDLAQHTAELELAGWGQLCVSFDLVPHSHCLDAFDDWGLWYLSLLDNKNYWWWEDFSVLPPLPDDSRVRMPLPLGGDHYVLVLPFKFLSHLPQAFSALTHVLH